MIDLTKPFRVQIVEGGCLERMRELPDASVDALVTDPPAGIEFMGKAWDHPETMFASAFTAHGSGKGIVAPSAPSRNLRCRICGGEQRRRVNAPEKACCCINPDFPTKEDRLARRAAFIATLTPIFAECLRVLKPGAHGLVWALPRTSHWTATALEDAGFEIRDVVSHLFGCLSEDTEILVNGRWEPYQKCVAGQHALCYDAEADTFQWGPIEAVYVYPYDNDAVRLVGKHTDQLVSREHRCPTERGGTTIFTAAWQIAREREARVPVLESLHELLRDLPVPNERISSPAHNVSPVRESPFPDLAGRQAPLLADDLQGVWQTVLAQEPRTAEKLLGEVLRCGEGTRSCDADTTEGGSGDRACGMDGRESGVSQREDDRQEQSGMERRSNVLRQARQLPANQVRALSAGVCGHGAKGRVRDGTQADRREGDGPRAAACGVCAPLQPQSEGQQDRESGVVSDEQGAQTVRASRYTTTDLVRVSVVHYTGVVWCVKTPTGAFVARRNGKIFVTGNSGFPKSMSCSAALDKAAGAEREVVGTRKLQGKARVLAGRNYNGDYADRIEKDTCDLTVPSTDTAKQWDGWGTALKPAAEQWILVRKPLSGTVAANLLKHGVGGLNIDACRIAAAPDDTTTNHARSDDGAVSKGKYGDSKAQETHQTAGQKLGRWPANVVMSHADECVCVGTRKVKAITGTAAGKMAGKNTDVYGKFGGSARAGDATGFGDADGTETVDAYACVPWCAVRRLDEQSGDRKAGSPVRGTEPSQDATPHGVYASRKRVPSAVERTDTGGVSRFYYVAKPSTAEREAGVPPATEGKRGNNHPTVKSIALMRWLTRLITPPGGIVLDPFAGSGTTGCAALLEGFRCVLIEREPAYVDIIAARVRYWRGKVTAP